MSKPLMVPAQCLKCHMLKTHCKNMDQNSLFYFWKVCLLMKPLYRHGQSLYPIDMADDITDDTTDDITLPTNKMVEFLFKRYGRFTKS